MFGIRRLLKRLVLGRPNGLRARLRRRFRCERPVEAPVQSTPKPRRESPFVDVCAECDLPEAEPGEFIVDGVPMAIVRRGDAVFAIDNTCPHAGGPLGDGDLEGDLLRCPLHGWGFSVETGRCDVDPSLVVTCYPARIREGRVQVEVGRPTL